MIRNKILILMLATTSLYGQMNFKDSSVQVISYWDLGEKYEYEVSLQKITYTEKDTTSNDLITYEVEVTVIDSTSKSYTVRWLYKNFNSTSENPIDQKLVSITEDIAVDIKLNELGVIESIENWEKVKNYISDALDTLKNEFDSIPGMDNIIQQMKAMHSTQASIEASSIQDAQQFHNFHGGKYNLNETIKGQLKTANLYDPSNPFDTDVSVVLEELDQENNQYIIRSIQKIDPAQLTQATYKYLNQLAKSLGQESIKNQEIKDLSSVVETVSRIHNTGWLLESILWKEVKAEGTTNMEIRTIKMK